MIEWGKHKENGVWISPYRHWRWRLMLGGADRLIFLALGPVRLRIVKP